MTDITETVRENAAEYTAHTDDDRPLGGYAGLLATYGGFVTLAVTLGRRQVREPMPVRDLVLGSLATFRLARTISHDPVTSPLRAPFTRYEGTQGPAEVAEEVRGTGFRHAIGELVSCPFCLAQWAATVIVVGLTFAPRFTRAAMNVLVMVTAADFLQFAYSKAMQSVQ